MLQMNVPKFFCEDVVLMVAFLLNGMSSQVLHGKSLFQMLFYDKDPSPLPLKVFGSVYFLHNLSSNHYKFDP